MKKSVRQVNSTVQENGDVCCADGFPLRKRPAFLSVSVYLFVLAVFPLLLPSTAEQMKSNQKRKN
ncbi:MAG: hypothetical protein IJ418_07445 [Clostridia bacterium]|nr:hypothetical protein [Clostridia bacterium]